MSRYDRDPTEFDRDLIIAYWHPEYADTSLVEALADLNQYRQKTPVGDGQ